MKYFLLSVLFASGLLACNNKDKKFDDHSYQEQKISLAEKERSNPKQFLRLSGDDHRNFWGKTVYKGLIKNTATVASYTNIRVKLLYFKEGKQVANHEEVFDNALAPNDDFSFKAKYKTPKGTDSVAAYIMSAKAAQ
jgi:hypothetical protein